MKKHRHEEDETVIDVGSGDEVVAEETEASEAALRDKLKQLRKELADCQKERDENLAGWQRAKADLINFRRNVEEDRTRDQARARGETVRTILPVLDSFESARAEQSWMNVEKEWREGVERIGEQLKGALTALGVEPFGALGEQFDPTYHDCVSIAPAKDDAPDNTIAQVLQTGYRVYGEVVRPAKVVVYQAT